MVGSGGIYKEEASHPVYALDGRLVHFAILINVGQTVGVGDNKEKFLGLAPTPKIIENYFDQVSFIDYLKNKIFNFFILYISICRPPQGARGTSIISLLFFRTTLKWAAFRRLMGEAAERLAGEAKEKEAKGKNKRKKKKGGGGGRMVFGR